MRKTFLVCLLVSVAFVSPQTAFAQSHDSHALPAPPDTLAGWAKGAQLFDGFHTAMYVSAAVAGGSAVVGLTMLGGVKMKNS